MKQYRLAQPEFFSIQGEGSFAGTPSVWVRTFGCNLKCPGFPCDTEYAWNKNYLPETLTRTAAEIHANLKALITDEYNPQGLLIHPLTNNEIHVLFTGGEPLLQKNQSLIMEVVDLFSKENEVVNFTIETNGTQFLTAEFKQWLQDGCKNKQCLISVSPKLPSVSGEHDQIKLDVLSDYVKNGFGVQFKFVANSSDECQREILDVVNLLKIQLYGYQDMYNLWIMPVGETREDQLLAAPIVEKYQALGFYIATRNHTYIWSNSKDR